MEILFQLAREPMMIGAFITVILLLVGVYFFSNWLYDIVISANVRLEPAASIQTARPPDHSEPAQAHYEDFFNTTVGVGESPHGLGPYPELPADWPHPLIWRTLEDSYYESAAGIEQELIHRVLVKLWKLGTKVDTGVMGDNGRVYPLYADTIYVQWAERKDAAGTPYRYLREALCLPELVQHEDAIEAGVIPSGVKVIEQDEAGIDPYVFLGLESIGFN